MKKRLVLVIILLLLVGVGLLVYLGQRRELNRELYYSGTIEATQADLAFQVTGRVKKVLLDEGQSAEKDEVLAELEQEEFLAQKGQAQANLDRSIQTLKQLEALLEVYKETLPAEVLRAEAAVKVLESSLEEMESGYRSQEVERARLTFEAAKATMEEAHKDKERFDRLYEEETVSEKERDQVALVFENRSREYQRARESLDLLKEGFRRESIESARARLSEGRAVLKQARSNLKKIEALKREIEAARALVRAYMSGLRLADIKLEHTFLKAPFKGLISSRNVEPGEVVSPTREVISLSNLSFVDLKVFVDETEIGRVRPGQKVEVRTDTFPDKVYAGSVSFISSEAEFTPKIIQTRKERVKLVYLVKISIPNPDLDLKAGMPADAWFR